MYMRRAPAGVNAWVSPLRWRRRVWLANIPIEAREIRLVDVLLAMGVAGRGDWGITDKGAFFHSADGRQQFYDEYWNLRMNDLAKQSPDTLRFLADLLGV